VLLTVLAGLLTTMFVVQIMPASPRRAAAVSPKAAGGHHSPTGGTAGKPHTGTAVPVPNIPGAFTGAVTRPRVGDGCGLALRARSSARPVGDCTVVEIGDSLGNDLGWGLQRELAPSAGLRLVQLDKSSTGLANSGYYDWQAQLAAALQSYHPQLVLISLGGNDEQGLYAHGAAVQFPTAAWQAAYTQRVGDLVREASASGAYVLWVGLPIMEQPSYSQGIRLLDSIYQKAVTAEPNATFVTTWPLLANRQGEFQSQAMVNGQSAALRAPDGIHYSYVGEDVLAAYVLREMALIYHVDLAPASEEKITGW